MKNFAIIGVAGYIAPRHLRAIKETGNTLIAALDKSDSVGVLDSYFPKAHFFVEYERFDRYIEKLKRRDSISLDYMSICTPNYLHDSHIRMGLRMGADIVCEKPVVLNPWNLEVLEAIERESEGRINTILQLRLHPNIINLKEKVEKEVLSKKYDVDLTYVTSRGNWYHTSWKGDESKSGGVITNIGIHFFDMLCWVFGGVQESLVHLREKDKASGYLEFEKARVRWFLSIDENDLPLKHRELGRRTYRSILVNNEEMEFSEGFDELHSLSYCKILEGEGFGLKESKNSINIAYDIRNTEVVNFGEKHILL